MRCTVRDIIIKMGTILLVFFDILREKWYNFIMNNLVLIGMPASGKSSAGVLVAKTLGCGFIDSDLVLQERTGMLLSALIETHGIEGFIRAEAEANCSIRTEKSVIATGGSAVYSETAMKYLKKIGTVVYLKLPYEAVEKRLGGILLSRGVVIRRGESLKDLYDERTPLYERYADIVVDCEGKTLEETVKDICLLFSAGE